VTVLACSDRKEYLIQVPEQTRITSEWILSELEEKAKNDPTNEWLLNQQLYFCEQMDWPVRCEQVLLRARSKWGLSERLIDQFVAYYVKQNSYKQLESILSGAIETRSRLEARVHIGLGKTPADTTALEKYLSRFEDEQSAILAIQGYMTLYDTARAVYYIEKLLTLNVTNRNVRRYYPVLSNQGKHELAIQILEMSLKEDPTNEEMRFDLAINYFEVDKMDTAKTILRTLNTDQGNVQLHDWFKAENALDSALHYAEKVTKASQTIQLLLSKAEILEATGRITRSLPYYESALEMDTTDFELRQRVDNVRRKVAYLRQIREQQDMPPPPKIERKNVGN
jgi:tetratricopeptide (TPR) repeat protein